MLSRPKTDLSIGFADGTYFESTSTSSRPFFMEKGKYDSGIEKVELDYESREMKLEQPLHSRVWTA